MILQEAVMVLGNTKMHIAVATLESSPVPELCSFFSLLPIGSATDKILHWVHRDLVPGSLEW